MFLGSDRTADRERLFPDPGRPVENEADIIDGNKVSTGEGTIFSEGVVGKAFDFNGAKGRVRIEDSSNDGSLDGVSGSRLTPGVDQIAAAGQTGFAL